MTVDKLINEFYATGRYGIFVNYRNSQWCVCEFTGLILKICLILCQKNVSYSEKMKIIAWQEFEHAYYNVTVKHVNHYAKWTHVNLSQLYVSKVPSSTIRDRIDNVCFLLNYSATVRMWHKDNFKRNTASLNSVF